MKGLLAIALAAAVVASPAAAQGQTESDYRKGVAARLAGHPDEAERLLQAWLAEHPGDVDAELQLAYAELALGRLDAAERGFRAVLAAAPNYKDASDGLAIVSSRRNAAGSEEQAQLILEGGWSALSGGAADWQEADARLVLPTGHATTLEAGADYYRRFGVDDVELSGTVTHRAGKDLWLRVTGGATPSADFRPRWSAGAGFDWRFHGGPTGTVLSFDGRYDDFPAQRVTTLMPALLQYFDGGRAWITARGYGVIPAGGKMQVGWSLRGDFEPKQRYQFFAGVADGPDTEIGVVTQVTSLFGGLELPLGKRFGLTASLAHEWRDLGFDRTEARLGLKVAL